MYQHKTDFKLRYWGRWIIGFFAFLWVLLKIRGWMGYKLINNYVAIVFDYPDRKSARVIIQENESNLLKNGG